MLQYCTLIRRLKKWKDVVEYTMNEKIISIEIKIFLKFLKNNEKYLSLNTDVNFELFYNRLFTENTHNILLKYLINETLVIYTSNPHHNDIMLLQDVKFRDEHIATRIYNIVKVLKFKKYNEDIQVRVRLLKADNQEYFFTKFLNLSEHLIERTNTNETDIFNNVVKISKRIDLKSKMRDSKDSEEKLMEYLLDYTSNSFVLNQTKTISTQFKPVTNVQHLSLPCKICSNILEIQNGNKKNIIQKEKKYLYRVLCNHSNNSIEEVKINIEIYKGILESIPMEEYIDFIIYNYYLLSNEK